MASPLPSTVFRPTDSAPWGLNRIPLPIRMAAGWLVLWLACLSLARLAFHLWFAPTGTDPSLALAALKLGFRFDLRLALWLVLPVLVIGTVPVLAPWSRLRVVRGLWGVVLTLGVAGVTLIYIVDAGHYAYLSQRINASVVNFAKDARTSAGMVWSTYPVLRILIGLVVFVTLFMSLTRALFRHGQGLGTARLPTTLLRRIGRRVIWTVLCAALVLFGIHGRWSQYPLRWSDAHELAGGPYLANLALNPVLALSDTAAFRRDSPDIAAVRRYYPRMASYLGVDRPDPRLGMGIVGVDRQLPAKPAARLAEQAAAAERVGLSIGDAGSVTQRAHRRHERAHGRLGGERERGRTLEVGHLRGMHAGDFLQGLADMRGARVAGHAADHEFGHGVALERCRHNVLRLVWPPARESDQSSRARRPCRRCVSRPSW